MSESPAALLARSLLSLPQDQRPEAMAQALKSLPKPDLIQLDYLWRFWARPNQLPPPGDWRFWLILTGRGWGKTRTGAEWVRSEAETSRYVNIIGATADDARDIMIQGESGILSICPPWRRPEYKKSERRLDWPNGAETLIFTADEPDRLRGKQHQRLWADELAAWRYGQEAWDQAMFGTRLPGQSVRVLVTTTPQPNNKVIRGLLKDPGCVVVRGITDENRSNLDPTWFSGIINRYQGTRLGRQELMGELLEDVPGALWTREQLDNLRLAEAPDLQRIVVAIDPAMTSGDNADETGIVAVGKARDGHAYVLRDVSGRFSPKTWAQRAAWLYHDLGADRVIGEVNNGGEMVEHTLRTADATIPYRAVHASRGKRVRAEPIAALYEQGRVHHIGGFPEMEDQMCNYTPDGYDGSPDRLDALVWALTELGLMATWVVA